MLRWSVFLLWSLTCSVQATDFVPIEVGNRWIYVHEIVDGSFVGDYTIDTCMVEVTQGDVDASPDGTDFSAALVLGLPFDFSGNPCWQVDPPARARDILTMRKDTQGNILWRPAEPLAKPDTAAFLELHPTWTAQRFGHQVDRVLRDDLVMVFDFIPTPGTEEFDAWYWNYLERAIGLTMFPPERNAPPPFVFKPDAERVILATDCICEVQSTIVFEDGVGVTFVDGWSIFGSPSQVNQTRLLWARIGGREYGLRPTSVAANSWAQLKTREAPIRRRLAPE